MKIVSGIKGNRARDNLRTLQCLLAYAPHLQRSTCIYSSALVVEHVAALPFSDTRLNNGKRENLLDDTMWTLYNRVADVKLTIYLLRERVTEFSCVLPARYREKDAYTEIEPTIKLPFHCRSWIQQNKSKPPRWIQWLSEAFAVRSKDLINQSNSFILVLKVKDRLFAVTFGYAFNAIDRALVEPDFGLKVTLSIVDPEALDTLDTRTLDRVTKLTRTHLNVGRPVEEFGI